MKTIHDPNLVFYADLAKHDGGLFMSDDAHGHLCTVTGATWGSQGRYFDGTDDFVNIGDPDSIIATNVGSVIIWTKPTALPALNSFLGYGGANVVSPGALDLEFRAVTGVYYYTITHTVEGVGAFDVIRGNTPISINNWYCCAITTDGSAYSLYVNNIAQTLSATLGGNAGDWFSDAAIPDTSSRRITIGVAQYDGDTINDYTGLVGEVLIYNRALTAAEIQNIYQITKWRYR